MIRSTAVLCQLLAAAGAMERSPCLALRLPSTTAPPNSPLAAALPSPPPCSFWRFARELLGAYRDNYRWSVQVRGRILLACAFEGEVLGTGHTGLRACQLGKGQAGAVCSPVVLGWPWAECADLARRASSR